MGIYQCADQFSILFPGPLPPDTPMGRCSNIDAQTMSILSIYQIPPCQAAFYTDPGMKMLIGRAPRRVQ